MEVTHLDCVAIRSVIEQQLTAFRQDNAIEAYTLASPAIQQQFGNAQTFLHMVRTAYPPVYRPRSVMFQALTTVEGEPAQQVLLMGPEGELVVAVYLMQKQLDSSWKINGCYLVPLEDEL